MNKYQKVLNDMYAVLINDGKRWHERKSLLQELVEKENPKHPFETEYEGIVCPNVQCGEPLERYSVQDRVRCSDCGQKIDWND